MEFKNVRAYLISVFVILVSVIIGGLISGNFSFNVASNNQTAVAADPQDKNDIRKEQPIKNVDDLPPGFSYQKSNFDEYRWVDRNGYPNIFEQKNYAEMVESAWSWYEFEKRKKDTVWK